MQPPTRGTSRARRSASVEAPSKHPARSPESTYFSLYRRLVPYTLLKPFFTTLSFFAAATDHAPLLAFPAFVVAFVVILIPSRPARLVSILRQARSFIAPLSILHALHVFFALYAIQLLGPARALIALAAPTSFPRRTRRGLLCFLLSLLALGLLAYDAYGGTASNPRVIRVRDKVLQSRPIHAVHTRLQDLSRTVESRYLARRRRRQAELAKRDDESNIDIPIDVLHPPEPGGSRHDTPPEPPQPLLHGFGRRLLAIVKGDAERDDDSQAKAESESFEQNGEAAKSQKRSGNTSSHVNSKERNDTQMEPAVAQEDDDEIAEQGPSARSASAEEASASSDQGSRQSIIGAIVGVILAVCSSITGMWAYQLRDRVLGEIGSLFSVHAISFVLCSATLFPVFLGYCIFGNLGEEPLRDVLVIEVIPRAVVFGLSFLFMPVVLQQLSIESLRMRYGSLSRGPPRAGFERDRSVFRFSLFGDDSAVHGTMSLYLFIIISMKVLKRLQLASTTVPHPLNPPSYLAAILLLFAALAQLRSMESANRKEAAVHTRSTSSGIQDFAAFLERTRTSRLRQVWKKASNLMYQGGRGVREVFIHAKSNKASWQVLNFLVLQSGMASAELVYAALTGSGGLISISADNLFCSVALAIGLLAIRATSKKPSAKYTYGFARYESLCGFANGIMLIYVAFLLVLEAFERLYDNDSVEVGRVFTVCLLGMIGNALGLYFFPPESRRENHNVHAIYLHIVANTLAYASMSICTAITAATPAWESVDMAASAVVASGIIVSAIPLIIRSARLLLLISPLERREAFKSVGTRLSDIEGVVKVTSMRIWSMTPTYFVASAKLEVSERFKGNDMEILHQARAIFASVGVPASQCTVQISRVDCDSSAVIFFHRRTKSGLRDTGIDIERLAIARQSSEQNRLTVQATPTFPNSVEM